MGQDSKGLKKSTSLQGWSKLTERYFHRKMRIEERKDREQIYRLIKQMGLPGERFHAFPTGDQLTEEEFRMVVVELKTPFWVSALPKIGVTDLNRVSKLRLEEVSEGWQFIQSLPRLADYKIVVMQYADNPEFKGSALVSKELNGVADFVAGDQHVQLAAGLTITDPMLFNSQRVFRYSKMVDQEKQDELYNFIKNHPGHFEFQYGLLDGEKKLSFFDFNDELAYEDIDGLFRSLLTWHQLKPTTDQDVLLRGLPASLGRAQGRVKVIKSDDVTTYQKVSEGDIMVTDATAPEMTQAMSRAAAIVTDLGGVTSHAAIVCREMEIPCIVGTKKGTEVLQENSLVEVDAAKGVVRLVD